MPNNTQTDILIDTIDELHIFAYIAIDEHMRKNNMTPDKMPIVWRKLYMAVDNVIDRVNFDA